MGSTLAVCQTSLQLADMALTGRLAAPAGHPSDQTECSTSYSPGHVGWRQAKRPRVAGSSHVCRAVVREPPELHVSHPAGWPPLLYIVRKQLWTPCALTCWLWLTLAACRS